ncbi:MAG: CoA-binding protein [Thermoprotei archaeon]
MNAEDELILKILKEYKNIATVGFSKDPSKPAHAVPKFLILKGYNVIPVNPTVDSILGRKSYKSLLEIPDRVEVVQIFRPSKDVPPIVDEAIKRARERGDVKVVWMQEGIRNDEAARKAQENGLIVIQDKCMYREYMRLIEKAKEIPPVTSLNL